MKRIVEDLERIVEALNRIVEALNRIVEALNRIIDRRVRVVTATDPGAVTPENVAAFFGFPRRVAVLLLKAGVWFGDFVETGPGTYRHVPH